MERVRVLARAQPTRAPGVGWPLTSKASIRVVLIRPVTRQKPRRMFWVLGLRRLATMPSTWARRPGGEPSQRMRRMWSESPELCGEVLPARDQCPTPAGFDDFRQLVDFSPLESDRRNNQIRLQIKDSVPHWEFQDASDGTECQEFGPVSRRCCGHSKFVRSRVHSTARAISKPSR